MVHLFTIITALILALGSPAGADLVIMQANAFASDCGKPARVASTNGGWAAAYPRDGKVVLFDSDGAKTGEITGLGAPVGIAFSAPDTLYIGEQDPACISVWRTNGIKLRTFGSSLLSKPSAIALDASGTKLYVLDPPNHTVRVLDTQGALLSSIGDAARLKYPTGMTLDASSSTLLIGEMITGVVHVYATNGAWLRDIGRFGKGQGEFMRAGGMGASDLGMVAVADPFLSRVQAIGTDGSFHAEEGTFGSGDDELMTPLDVAVGPGQRLAVADFANGRIVEYWLCYDSARNALAQQDGTFVNLIGPIVTAGTGDFGTSIYVEQDDRSSGIRVDNVGSAVDRGALMQISGYLATDNGERHINASSLTSIVGWVTPALFGMSAAALGGASPYGPATLIEAGVGPYNVGLLVRVWGRVTRVDADDFYISAGSAQPVWVHAPGITKPVEDAYVGVTGICSAAADTDGKLRARVLPRNAADIDDLQGGN